MVSKASFTFLRALEKNNNRDWFNANKEKYKVHQAELKSLAEEIKIELGKKDEIEKAKVHRIYRDIRFSKDKTPFKNYFGLSFSRAGKHRRGGFFVRLEPNNSFAAGGFFSPSSADLKHVRKQIQADPSELRNILKSRTLKNSYGEMRGDAVKTAPKGFEKDDPAIDLLRYKQYYFLHEFSNSEVHEKGFAKKVAKEYEKLRPYFNYMSDILTTDLNGVSLI